MIKARWGLNTEEETAKEIATAPPLADLITTGGSIRTVENNVFFYADVESSSCCELNRILREVDCRLHQAQTVLKAESFTPTIHLRINSNGGDVFAGLSTVDTIRNIKSKVYTYVEGAAASAATLISVAGARRFIGTHSFMLIHQLSSIIGGTFEQMEDGHENNKRIMQLIKNIYKTYTKISMKELDNILKHDLWWTSDECLKYGLVDEVI